MFKAIVFESVRMLAITGAGVGSICGGHIAAKSFFKESEGDHPILRVALTSFGTLGGMVIGAGIGCLITPMIFFTSPITFPTILLYNLEKAETPIVKVD